MYQMGVSHVRFNAELEAGKKICSFLTNFES
jgi:hypothetical protein